MFIRGGRARDGNSCRLRHQLARSNNLVFFFLNDVFKHWKNNLYDKEIFVCSVGLMFNKRSICTLILREKKCGGGLFDFLSTIKVISVCPIPGLPGNICLWLSI